MTGTDDHWFTLETIKQCVEGVTGYPGYQYGYQGSKTWRRRATDDTGVAWTAWVQDLDRAAYVGDLNATKNISSRDLFINRPTGADGDLFFATDTLVLYQNIAGTWTTGATVGARAGVDLLSVGGVVLSDAALLNSYISVTATGALSNGSGTGGQIQTLPVLDRDREVDRPPSWYPTGHTYDFKHALAIGLSDADGYWVTLETIKQFVQSGGGFPGYQYCYQEAKTWRRRATDDTGVAWTAWVRDLDRAAYVGDLAATANIIGSGLLSARPTGANGDFFFATDTAVLYQKVAGTWVSGSTAGAPTGTNVAGTAAVSVAANAISALQSGSVVPGATGVSFVDATAAAGTARIRSLAAGAGLNAYVSGESVVLESTSPPLQSIRLSTEVSTTSTTVADISGMALALLANTTYRITGLLRTSTAAATTGHVIGFTVPTGAVATLVCRAPTSAAGASESLVIDLPTGGSGSATFSAGLTASFIEIDGVVSVSTTAGNVQLRQATEVAASQVATRVGSTLLAMPISNATTATVFNLNGTVNLGMAASYGAAAFNGSAGPANATATLQFKRDGTWTVSYSRSPGTTPAPNNGNWCSVTDADAGTQWEVKFVPGTLTNTGTGGSGSASNAAADWLPLTATRTYALSASVTGGVGNTWTTSAAVVVHMRRISDGTTSTPATVTLSADADSDI